MQIAIAATHQVMEGMIGQFGGDSMFEQSSFFPFFLTLGSRSGISLWIAWGLLSRSRLDFGGGKAVKIGRCGSAKWFGS